MDARIPSGSWLRTWGKPKRTSLTAAEVAEVHSLRAEGYSRSAIAATLGITVSLVHGAENKTPATAGTERGSA